MSYTCVVEGLTTRQAAGAVGIDRVTLQRWIAAGLVRAPKAVVQDGRAVRLWSEADIQRLRSRKDQIYRKGRGRKPRPKPE